MASAASRDSVPVEQIELDESNPRIAHFLEHLERPYTAEQIFIALGAGGDEDGAGGPSFQKLKQSIITSGGIIQPVILRQTDKDKYVCIEGNTRVQLYKDFVGSGRPGEWETIPAVIHKNINDEQVHAIRLQAHLVGPRPWNPYSKAKYLVHLRNEDHFPLARLVDLCGGSERTIVESITAFEDMEHYYRPQLESDEDFDTTRFSGFVELQKSGVKEAIIRAGFNLDDFSRWIIDGKIEKLAHVRWLPKVLRDKHSTAIFVNSGIEEAIRQTDLPDLGKALQDATLVSLARALTEGLRRIEYGEVKKLKEDPASANAQYLAEAYEALKEIVTEIGLEAA